MPLELVNPDPRYTKVHLIEAAPLGYLHLAADVQAPHRPGPRRSSIRPGPAHPGVSLARHAEIQGGAGSRRAQLAQPLS
jgi:hypothetical protein